MMSNQKNYPPIHIGRIKYILPKKGFGYVRVPETREEFYFRASNQEEELTANDVVQFEIKETRQGLIAVNLQLISS
ncbi:MAG: cold shock domain-containing protein [Bacteroidota bacterium]